MYETKGQVWSRAPWLGACLPAELLGSTTASSNFGTSEVEPGLSCPLLCRGASAQGSSHGAGPWGSPSPIACTTAQVVPK